jgi:DNA recombination protein RmuC
LVEALLSLVAALLIAAIVLLAVLLRRSSRDPAAPLAPKIEALSGTQERTERLVQEELKRNREESAGNARHLREEVGASIKGMSDSVEKRVSEMRGVVDVRLQQIQQESGKKLDAMRETVEEKLQGTLENSTRCGRPWRRSSRGPWRSVWANPSSR